MGSDWKSELKHAFTKPQSVLAALGRPVEEPLRLDAVARAFAVRIPEYYLSLIDPSDPNDPIALQCLPDLAELEPDSTDLPDAVGDTAMSPVAGIVQKHPNRVILLVSNTCSMYCRFCFRRPVAPGLAVQGLRDDLAGAMSYIEGHSEIREVILSGGDPLMLDDDALARTLARLREIKHVRMLRIHTRMPVTLPSRVTTELAGCLHSFRPMTLVTHFNHPRELTPVATGGLSRLREAGIPLLNQSVLLRRINDSADTLAELCWRLLEAGVMPYYLHHCDRTSGTGPFRTSISTGLQLMQHLHRVLPGYAVPRYVIDIPGGFGKVALEGPAARRIGPARWALTSSSGIVVAYEDILDHCA